MKNPLFHLPHFCSQANGLLSPVVNSTVPANTGSSDRNNVDFMESMLPTVSILPSVYIGSRSTDLHSPIPPSYITKSLFDLSLSLLSLTLLIVAVMLLLTQGLSDVRDIFVDWVPNPEGCRHVQLLIE